MNLEGDESPIPEDPFENKDELGKMEQTNFNFKENFIATTGVAFSEEAEIGPNKFEMCLLSKGDLFEEMKSNNSLRMTRSKLLNVQSKEVNCAS